MKFKRIMTAIWTSALVLGCSFLLFPQFSLFEAATKEDPEVAGSAMLSSTPIPTPTKTPTRRPTATPAPTAVPTRLPLLLQEDVLESPISVVDKLVRDYIDAYYKNDITTLSTLVTDPSLLNEEEIKADIDHVRAISDLTLYKKSGINGINCVVYACYNKEFTGKRQPYPTFAEFYIKRQPDNSYRIMTEPLSEETAELMLAARQTEEVLELSISSLLKRFGNACLENNEEFMNSCVSDPVFINHDYYSARYAYTEHLSDYELYLTDGIKEFDYIALVSYLEKIVLIDTPAPCLESFFIRLDEETGLPCIYLGVTSLETDAYCASVMQSDEVQALATAANEAMEAALAKDDDLREIYEHLLNGAVQE